MKQILSVVAVYFLGMGIMEAQEGSLDTTFGGVKVRDRVTSQYDFIVDVAVRSDDQTYAVAHSSDGLFTTNAVLLKYLADGILDGEFGTQGKVLTPLTINGSVASLDIRTDGKIIVAGLDNVDGVDHAYLAAFNQDGVPDSAFGTGGVVRIAVGSGSELRAVHINSNNGDIIAAGTAGGQLFALFRFHQDGTLDSAFATNGVANDDLTGGGEGWLNDLAYNPADGTMLVAGSGYTMSGIAAVVARYTDGGVLDATFGSSGIVTADLGGFNPIFTSILLQPDGRIVAVGSVDTPSGSEIKIVRYTSSGIPDSTFGTGGIVTVDNGTTNYASSASLQNDGKIVVAGNIDDDAVVLRFDSSGVPDASFSGDGMVLDRIAGIKTIWNSTAVKSDGTIVTGGMVENSGTYTFAYANYAENGTLARTGRTITGTGYDNLQWHSVAAHSDGKSVAAGSAYVNGIEHIVVGRFDADGFPDETFGTFGVTATSLQGFSDEGKAVAVRSDGKIVVAYKAGTLAGSPDFGVVRYTDSGVLDAGFGTGGAASIDMGGGDHPAAMVTRPDGRIIVGGQSINGTTMFALAQFNENGTIDTAFGAGGKVVTSIPETDGAYLTAIALQSNGKIVAVGSNYGIASQFVAVRYDTAGSVDSTFGSNGNGVIMSNFGEYSVALAVAVQSDGKVIVGGYSYTGVQNVFTIVRYTSSGIVDSSFGTNGVVQTAVGSSSDQITALLLQSDGKIVAGGRSGDINFTEHGVFARYESDGSPDAGFGTDGILVTGIYDNDATVIASLAAFPDGKIVAAGNVDRNLTETLDGLLMRVNATSVPLPVELTLLHAEYRRPDVELRWKTATEVNNYGFDVERKTIDNEQSKGNTWIKTGFVEGSGTTNAPKEYSFTDATVRSGKYAYRLRQIDHDGTFSYSPQVEVQVGSAPAQFALEQNYPNPFNPATTIGFTLQQSGQTTLTIYDAIGREVATLVNEPLEAGRYYRRDFDASHLSSGVYIARLRSGNAWQVRKLLLMK